MRESSVILAYSLGFMSNFISNFVSKLLPARGAKIAARGLLPRVFMGQLITSTLLTRACIPTGGADLCFLDAIITSAGDVLVNADHIVYMITTGQARINPLLDRVVQLKPVSHKREVEVIDIRPIDTEAQNS
jgi:hypothetical protein